MENSKRIYLLDLASRDMERTIDPVSSMNEKLKIMTDQCIAGIYKVEGTLQEKLETIEKELIIEAVSVSKGNLSKAAAKLGLTDRMMGLRAKKYDINFKDYRVLALA
jgi:transcriptional regulator with GAF, ATPase, and Fis domain